jgi:hypothetical protein
MATKKKSAKKPKAKPAQKKKLKKRSLPRPLKKASSRAKTSAKKTARRAKPKKLARPKKGFAAKSEVVDTVVYEPAGLGPRSGGQSGDLQGLSDRRRANSQSVDELLEEGNSFEAEVVKGVEDVVDEEEVHTHEVPEDDVPGEYLDKD